MKTLLAILLSATIGITNEIYLDGESVREVDSLFLLFASAEGMQKAFEQKRFRQKDMLDEDVETKAKYFDHMILHNQATVAQKKVWYDLAVATCRRKYEYLYALSQAATGDIRARIFLAYKKALQEHGAIARLNR